MDFPDIFKESEGSLQLLKEFDKDEDEQLNRDEFGALCASLFQNTSAEAYPLGEEEMNSLFEIFDLNEDGFICPLELEACFTGWIQKIVNPVSVLVVVDVQNDFIEGSLALRDGPAGQDGKEVVAPINKMLETIPFKKVFYTKDWHPPEHISYIDNVDKWPLHKTSPIQDPREAKVMDTVIFAGEEGEPIEQRLYPIHCIQNTWGSELDPDLNIIPDSTIVCKGDRPEVESNSGFLDNQKKSMTQLKTFIEEVGGKGCLVFVCGLAYDICVGLTAVDSLNLGFRTVVVEDAARGLDLQEIEKMKEQILELGGVLAQTGNVKEMVLGYDRRPELGGHLARTLHRERILSANNNSEGDDQP